MAKHTSSSVVDMDRLSRVFSWLIVPILVFMLGMVFANAMNSELAANTIETSTVSIEREPYTLDYPAAWSASYSENADTATDVETTLIIDDAAIQPIEAFGDRNLVTLSKIRASANNSWEAALTAATATPITIPGADQAVKGLPNDSIGTTDEYIIKVDDRFYLLDVATTVGGTSYDEEMQIVLDSLSFTK